MKAIVIRIPGGPEVLELKEVPDPVLKEGEVIIKITATALNRADIIQRRGSYPPPAGAPQYPGLECSGIIEEVAPGVPEDWEAGMEVFFLQLFIIARCRCSGFKCSACGKGCFPVAFRRLLISLYPASGLCVAWGRRIRRQGCSSVWSVASRSQRDYFARCRSIARSGLHCLVHCFHDLQLTGWRNFLGIMKTACCLCCPSSACVCL